MKPSKISILFIINSIIIVLISSLYLFFKFNSIPNIIPIHYSGKTADAFGSKNYVWFAPVINIIIIGGATLCIYKMKIPTSADAFLESSPEKAIKNRQLLLSVIVLISTLLISGLNIINLL